MRLTTAAYILLVIWIVIEIQEYLLCVSANSKNARSTALAEVCGFWVLLVSVPNKTVLFANIRPEHIYQTSSTVVLLCTSVSVSSYAQT